MWKSRWPSWAPRPNEPNGFCGGKATSNHSLSLICQPDIRGHEALHHHHLHHHHHISVIQRTCRQPMQNRSVHAHRLFCENRGSDSLAKQHTVAARTFREWTRSSSVTYRLLRIISRSWWTNTQPKSLIQTAAVSQNNHSTCHKPTAKKHSKVCVASCKQTRLPRTLSLVPHTHCSGWWYQTFKPQCTGLSWFASRIYVVTARVWETRPKCWC